MPEVARQFWREIVRQARPLLASSRRLPRAVRRLPVVPVWRAPLARPRYVRASTREIGFGGVRFPLGGIRSPFGDGRRWRPTRLFANNEVGGWWDPSDLSTMFQDSAGTTPVTAVEQPVGLHLDKSKGLALGAELVVNGGFDTNTTGWTVVGTATFNSVGGQGVLTVTSGSFFAGQSLATTSGKWYEVRGRFVSKSGGSTAFFRAGTSAIGGSEYFTTNPTVDGTDYVYRVLATGSTLYIAVGVNASGYSSTWDNISVREIAGNHRYQSTSAARPTLSARYNLLTKTEDGSTWQPDSTTYAAYGVAIPEAGAAGSFGFSRASAGTNYPRGPSGVDAASGVQMKCRAWVWLVSGSATVTPAAYYNSTWNDVASALAITSTPTLFEWTYTPTTATSFGSAFALKVAAAGAYDLRITAADCRPANDGVGLPAYQRVNTATDYDTSGFPMYLKYDGVDDWMQTASVDFSGTDAVTHFVGLRKLSDAAQATIHELGDGATAANRFNLNGRSYIAAVKYLYVQAGSVTPSNPYTESTNAAHAAPHTAVMTCAGKISTDYSIIRINGVQEGSDSDDQGSGNFANLPIYFYARGGTSLFHNAREYQTVIVGRAVTASEMASAEAFVNSKTKAY